MSGPENLASPGIVLSQFPWHTAPRKFFAFAFLCNGVTLLTFFIHIFSLSVPFFLWPLRMLLIDLLSSSLLFFLPHGILLACGVQLLFFEFLPFWSSRRQVLFFLLFMLRTISFGLQGPPLSLLSGSFRSTVDF